LGLYISESIRKREFGKLIPPADKAALLHRALPELAQPLVGNDLPKDIRLKTLPIEAAQQRNRVFV
jgi:hypothetical protein